MKTFLRAFLSIVLAFAGSAWAQDYPNKPVHLVVPFPAGGGTDVLARMVAERISPRLGQPVLVENRPGATGNIGTTYAARSRPDGYTVLLHISMFPAYRLTFNRLDYDGFTDFTPVGTIARGPSVLVVHPSSPLRTLKDVVEAGRTRPLTYGSAGIGSPQHLAMAHLAQTHRFKVEHILYKGTATAVTDLLGQQIDMVAAGVGSVLPLMEANRLRAVAVLGPNRSPLMPDVPTAAEAGFAGIEGGVHFLLLVPAKTPQPVIDRLNRELTQALADPALRAAFAKLGFEPLQRSSEQSAAMMKTDFETLEPIIRGLNLDKQ